MGDRHGGVRLGHGPVEQQGAGRRRRTLRQPCPPLLVSVTERALEQRPHDAEGEVALERPRRGVAHDAAGLRRLPRGVLEQGGLAQARGRGDDHDAAGAAGDTRDPGVEGLELVRALDERRGGPGGSRAM